MKERSYAAPVVVLLIFLLLVTYVGSYFALVRPEFGNFPTTVDSVVTAEGNTLTWTYDRGYLNGGDWAAVIYWPLEQVDRRIRPSAWEQRCP